MDEVSYRPMRADDAETALLARVHEDAPRNWLADYVAPPERLAQRTEYFRKRCSNERSLFLVAEAPSGRVVGFHWLDLEDDGAHIHSLWVAEASQGRGIGRELKRRGEVWARERGARAVKTLVHSRNARMLSLNRRMGFEDGFLEMTKAL